MDQTQPRETDGRRFPAALTLTVKKGTQRLLQHETGGAELQVPRARDSACLRVPAALCLQPAVPKETPGDATAARSRAQAITEPRWYAEGSGPCRRCVCGGTAGPVRCSPAPLLPTDGPGGALRSAGRRRRRRATTVAARPGPGSTAPHLAAAFRWPPVPEPPVAPSRHHRSPPGRGGAAAGPSPLPSSWPPSSWPGPKAWRGGEKRLRWERGR